MNNILSRRVAKILPDVSGLNKLMDKQKLRIYLGIDPTGGQLHIGHAIGIKKLMEFADMGHEAILLFGTGTVLVGDPSLREHARQKLSQVEIENNIQSWKTQVEPIVDFSKVTIKQNGDWLTKMTLKDIISVASNISAVQLFKRDSFTRRLEQGDTVWYHETMYPLLQGYDSVVMDVDLEIGGTDQEFNMLMGRELQKKINNHEKYVLTTPMIMGTDGRSMSKTSNNCVWLQDPPEEMFAKLMTVADDQIVPYFELCTDVPEVDIAEVKSQLESGVNPRDLKLNMAQEVTKIWYDNKEAQQAKEGWISQFSEGGVPENTVSKSLEIRTWSLDELLMEAGLASSKSEARRLIEQGAVRLNQDKVTSKKILIQSGDVLQAGKRRFIKIS
jgi:tyrosyl-tRNA synthetase